MCSAFLRIVVAALVFSAPATARELRVCADPNNLPFSNDRGEGFENKIVDLIAAEIRADVHYTWWAQRRGFIRNTLKEGLCDLVPGTPANMEMLRTTQPYYRSGYVFVTRRDANLGISSLNDPVLRSLRIGVQIIGDDGSNAPPAHALTRRGIVENVRGYTVYGDYAKPNPAGDAVAALIRDDVDVAVVWGPFAGYAAAQHPGLLAITPVRPVIDGPTLPMVFDISMGVRRGEESFREEINAALRAKRPEIDAILASYGVPRLDTTQKAAR